MDKHQTTILVVDDDRVSLELLGEVLRKEGYPTTLADTGEKASALVAQQDFSIILSDVQMHGKSGFDLLREMKVSEKAGERAPSVFILMTGFGSMDGALDAFKQEAFDYISKPFALDDLRSLVARAAKVSEVLRAPHTEAVGITGGVSPHLARSLTGRSPQIVEVYRRIARASLASSSVLISGEAGTGKALVARAIHENGARKSGPFVVLAEREDFLGLEENLERWAGGTLLIEELHGLTPSEQSRTLRAIEAAETRGIDVRWIATARIPANELARIDAIRPELLDRLNVLAIEIPALRNRIEDLPELVGVFLARYAEKNRKPISHLADSALDCLRNYSWPGNVRELERVLEKAVAMSAGVILEIEDFPELAGKSAVDAASPDLGSESLETVERAHILRVLAETGFNKSKASEILGIDRATLYRKAKVYGIVLRPSDPSL